jgi:hypothetical protein
LDQTIIMEKRKRKGEKVFEGEGKRGVKRLK